MLGRISGQSRVANDGMTELKDMSEKPCLYGIDIETFGGCALHEFAGMGNKFHDGLFRHVRSIVVDIGEPQFDEARPHHKVTAIAKSRYGLI